MDGWLGGQANGWAGVGKMKDEEVWMTEINYLDT